MTVQKWSPVCLPPSLTHVVHDGGLSSLAIEVDHGIDTGRDVPGRRALSHAVYKEVEAAVFFPHYAYCVTRLQEGKKWKKGLIKMQKEKVRSVVGGGRGKEGDGYIKAGSDCQLSNKSKKNVTHLEPVQVVSVLIQYGCSVVHYAIPRHHPRPWKTITQLWDLCLKGIA